MAANEQEAVDAANADLTRRVAQLTEDCGQKDERVNELERQLADCQVGPRRILGDGNPHKTRAVRSLTFLRVGQANGAANLSLLTQSQVRNGCARQGSTVSTSAPCDSRPRPTAQERSRALEGELAGHDRTHPSSCEPGSEQLLRRLQARGSHRHRPWNVHAITDHCGRCRRRRRKSSGSGWSGRRTRRSCGRSGHGGCGGPRPGRAA
jgi:hypothetical protein